MRRQFNVKAFACVLVVLTVLGVAGHQVHAYQVRRNAQALRAQAERAEENEDRTKAIRYLGHYLKLAPHDNEATFRLAEILDNEGIKENNLFLRQRAFDLYERGLRRDPEQSAARRRQVDTAMALRKYKDALDHLKDFLLKESPKDAELHHLAARCSEGLGRIEGTKDQPGAKEHYLAAIQYGPDRLEDYVALARLYRQPPLNDLVKSNEMLEKMTQGPNAKSARAWTLRARFAMEFEANPAGLAVARKYLEKARELGPNEVETLLADVALVQATEKREDALPKARNLLLRARERDPKNARIYLGLISIEQQAGKADAALRYANEGLKVLPDNVTLLQTKAELLILRGLFPEAQDVLSTLRKGRGNPLTLAVLEAEMLARQGRWGEVLENLERLRGRAVNWEPRLARRIQELLGMGYTVLGNPDQALNAYQEAVRLDPLAVSSRYELAGALALLGRLDDAIREYRQVLGASRPPAGAKLMLTRVLLRKALTLPEKERDWASIKKMAEQAARETPGAPEIAILQAEILLLEKPGQQKQARETLEKARDKNPTEPALHIALADLTRQEKDATAALAVLDKALGQRGLKEPVRIQLARIRFWSELPVRSARPKLQDLEKQAGRLSTADRQTILSALGIAWFRLGQRAVARRVCQALADEQPNNLGLRVILFDLAVELGQEQEAQRWLASMREIEGRQGATWRYADAALRLRQALRSENRVELLRDVRKRIEEALERRPTWARLHALMGVLAESEGNPDRAIEHYQEAVRRGDKRPWVVRHYVLLLYARGRAREADQEVRRLLNEERTLLGAGLGPLAAVGLVQTGELEQALDLARKVVPENSKNPLQQLWLAQMLVASGKKKEAEEMLLRVTRQAPDRPEGWIALVGFLADANRKQEALAAMSRASEKLPTALRSVTLGQCHEVLDQLDNAERLYDKAIEESKRAPGVLLHVAEFFRRKGETAKAVTLFRELLDKNSKVTSEQMPLIRRLLAIALTQGGDHASFQEARRLIEKNLASWGSPADRRAEILILSMRSYGRKDAIRRLEGLEKQSSLTPEERFALARLLDRDGEWTKAQVQYQLAVKEKGSQPAHLAGYAIRLIQQKQLERAEALLKDLRKREPESFRSCNLQAQLFAAQGKPDDALALLRAYVKKRPMNLSLMGHAYENLASVGPKKKEFLGEAEEVFRQHGEKSKTPARWLPLAEFYARQNRSSEALDICDRALKEKASPVVIATMMAAVVQNEPLPTLITRVEKFLEQTIKKEGDIPPVVVALADLRLVQKKPDDAEALYRRALARDANNIPALNNLAWLIAIRGGKVEEGLDKINRAIDQAGPAAELLDTRALLYLRQHKPELAVEDLRNALEQAKVASYSFHLAQAYNSQREKARAMSALVEARRLGFQPEQLQPLERSDYDKLIKDLDLR
jgi:tetratricopeptide (TPR) repeat protein